MPVAIVVELVAGFINRGAYVGLSASPRVEVALESVRAISQATVGHTDLGIYGAMLRFSAVIILAAGSVACRFSHHETCVAHPAIGAIFIHSTK